MTLNYKHLLFFGAISALLPILFLGQFYDHHGDRALYIKNRPTFPQIFRQPAKNQLPEATQDTAKNAVEMEINRAVIKQREKGSAGVLFFTIVFVEMGIMLLLSGCFSLLKKIAFSMRQLIVQFSINFFVAFFSVSYSLFIGNATTTYILFTILVITNYLTIGIYNIINSQSEKNKSESSI